MFAVGGGTITWFFLVSFLTADPAASAAVAVAALEAAHRPLLQLPFLAKSLLIVCSQQLVSQLVSSGQPGQ